MLKSYKLMFDEEYIYEITKASLSEIRDFVKYDICNLVYFNDDMSYAIVLLSSCIDEENSSRFQDKLISLTKKTHDNLFSLLAEERQAIIFSCPNAQNSKEDSYEPSFENIRNEVYIPLMNIDATELIGCLYLGSYDSDNVFKHEYLIDKKFLNKMMGIQGIFTIIYDKFREIRFITRMIHIMDDIVRQRDPFMLNHHYGVANWATAIADKLNFSKDKKDKLYVAAVFHDIGKLYVSEFILNKKGSCPMRNTLL